MIFSDLPLARRLEAAEAANAQGCTAIHPEAASLDVAGGCAVFVGAESPLTPRGGYRAQRSCNRADQIALLEDFFRERGAKVSIDLCPLADAGMLGPPRRPRLPPDGIQQRAGAADWPAGKSS